MLDQVRAKARALAPPPQRAVKQVAVAVVGIALVLALWFTRSPGVLVSAAVPTPGPSAATDADAIVDPAHGSAAPTGQLVVHVSGSVRSPGLVRLAPGARVLDAITAAGGLVRAGDAESLNLARTLVDGEQIVAGAQVAPGPVAGSAPNPDGAGGDLINLNTADANTLQELPGVGPVLAGRIVDWRTKNGPFRSVEDLGEVSGIGESRLGDLRDRVRVG